MRTSRALRWCLASIAILLCRCNKDAQTTEPPASLRDDSVRHVTATAASYRPQQSVIGQVVSRRKITLRAAQAGRVADCPWQVGQTLSKGQVFCRLEGPRIERSRQLLSDNIQMLLEQNAKLQADVDRLSKLQSSRVVGEKDKNLLTAEAALRESQLAIAKARNELKNTEAADTVLAPVDGRIIALHVREGCDVAEEEALANMSIPSDLAIEFAVFPVHDLHLGQGTLAEVYLERHDDSPILLHVDYVLPVADQRSGVSVAGICLGEYNNAVIVGQRLTVKLLGEKVSTVLVPESAVVARAGKMFCLRRTNGTWQPVEVTVLGRDDTGRLYLTGGVHPGVEIATEGAYGLIYRDFRQLFTFED